MDKVTVHTVMEPNPNDGLIYIELNGEYFPEFEWFDVLLGVIDMWNIELARFIQQGFNNPCELYFMDGPYYMILSKKESFILSLCENENITKTVVIDINFFLNSLFEQTQHFLKHVLELKDNTPYLRKINSIQSNAMIIEKFIKTLRH